MDNQNRGLRRAKRAAVQSTKAFYVNGEWDDVRALSKALQASMSLQKNLTMNVYESDSDSESVNYNNDRECNSRIDDNNKAPSNNPKKKKLIKYINRIDSKSKNHRNKPKLELPSTMFIDYIPNAADLFQWAMNTSAEELRDVPKSSASFPFRGMTMNEYLNKFANVCHNDETIIPKTDEELPDIFKEYYKRNREEYLARQKQDHESNFSRDETQLSSKSSTKENGDMNGNGHYPEEITISDDSEIDMSLELLHSRLDRNLINSKIPKRSRRQRFVLREKSIKKKKKSEAARNSQREETHQRANQRYNDPKIRDRLERALTNSKLAVQQNRIDNNQRDDSEESSSSSSDEELTNPPKRPKLRKISHSIRRSLNFNGKRITRSGSKRSLRGSRHSST